MRYPFVITMIVFLTFMAPAKANLCLKAIDLLSDQINVPKKLLLQIAKVESGFGPHRAPWPWSIHIQGKSYYFKKQSAAALYIKHLLALGIENFDVGCCQINYYWHKDKIRTPLDLLNPTKNILIATQYLETLKAQYHTWHKAVAHYHSSNLQKGFAYAKLVFQS